MGPNSERNMVSIVRYQQEGNPFISVHPPFLTHTVGPRYCVVGILLFVFLFPHNFFHSPAYPNVFLTLAQTCKLSDWSPKSQPVVFNLFVQIVNF